MLPVVELKEITHAYLGDREASLAIEDFNLSVGQGEFVSLVGPSGCGKTTLLSIIAGLLRPSRGEVLLSGRSAAGPSPEVGYMLQQDYLFPWRSIQDNALLGLELTGRLDEASRSKPCSCWPIWGLRARSLPFRLSSRAECASASLWCGRWRQIPACCCWMNRSPRWITRLSCSWRIWSRRR